MNRLQFSNDTAIERDLTGRSDVACFVGLVFRSAVRLPLSCRTWLLHQGWINDVNVIPESVKDLLNVPIPIESWSQFELLFSNYSPISELHDLNGNDVQETQRGDGVRVLESFVTRTGNHYLASAVRSFFAEGGRRCYVVRVGDVFDTRPHEGTFVDEVTTARRAIVPQLDPAYSFSPADRSSWRGVTHLTGLTDVSFVSTPDLPRLFADGGDSKLQLDPPTLAGNAQLPEQFVDCSQALTNDAEDSTDPLANLATGERYAPRCGESTLRQWLRAVNAIAQFLAQRHREAQLVAGMPLMRGGDLAYGKIRLGGASGSDDGSEASTTWAREDLATDQSVLSRHVQLTFPWLKAPQASSLPERLMPGDGVLVGMLARNALTRGTYRSATRLAPTSIDDVFPKLSQADAYGAYQIGESLADRISLFEMLPNGVTLSSDVTTSTNGSLRPASITRITALVVRNARLIGEEILFETSGPQLWSALERRLRNLLAELFDVGALDGRSPADAYTARCGRTTMSQNDIDNGRIVAQIMIRPAASIESINVHLVLQGNGPLAPNVATKIAAAGHVV